MAKKPNKISVEQTANPLAGIDDGLGPTRKLDSNELIYQSIMKGGGAPFGSPFAMGLASLTERIVKLFGLKGFFGFETMEYKRKKRGNKFTLYSSGRFMGAYDQRAATKAAKRLEKRRAKGEKKTKGWW